VTITEILLNFRAALVAVIPTVERIGIPWKRPDSYDEWDAIATVLFENLVVHTVRWSLPDPAREGFRLPPYDLLLQKYGGVSTIEANHPGLPDGRWLFHAFGTSEKPLDIVELRLLTVDGRPIVEELTACSVEEVRFQLRLQESVDGHRLINEIRLE